MQNRSQLKLSRVNDKFKKLLKVKDHEFLHVMGKTLILILIFLSIKTLIENRQSVKICKMYKRTKIHKKLGINDMHEKISNFE